MHVAREFGLLGIQLVAAELGTEFGIVAIVHNGAAIKIIAHIGIDFIVKGIGQQRGAAVFETHVAAQFSHTLLTVVMQHIAIDPQRVTLGHAYMSKGIE